jgi:methionyl-tRNA formyltransferase
MGTPAFAVPCLERLAADGHDVAAVFTQPDKPQGRKMLLAPPPVKVCALAHGLPVVQPQRLKDNAEVLEQLRALAPDLIVVTAYGKILPQTLLELPALGCVNIHASLLPKYRGAAPIQWAVLNGETETGVTAMQMDAGLDTGDMLLRAKTPIPEDMTAGQLYESLSVLGADVLSQTIELLGQGRLLPQRQDDSQSSYAPMLTRALSPLDFRRPARELHNQVRGLHPWPGATTEHGGKTLKVIRSKVLEEPRGFCVACGDGLWLELMEVQPEGRRSMAGEEFLRGIRRE